MERLTHFCILFSSKDQLKWKFFCNKFLLITNLTHFFMYLFISSLYMFRASQCSSSGERIVLIHHLIWLVCVSDRLVCRSRGKLQPLVHVMDRDDISSKDVQGRLPTALCHICHAIVLNRLWYSAVGNRPWTSLLDIHHPDPWHAPVAATTVFSTPDDGRKKRPKHVEWSCSD